MPIALYLLSNGQKELAESNGPERLTGAEPDIAKLKKNKKMAEFNMVATSNAIEIDNAVATASVEPVNNTNTMETFNFDIPQEDAYKKYDNEGAYKTLQVMMNSKEHLVVKFYSGKDNKPCAWIESKKVAGFKYELKGETFRGLLNYLINGEVSDFDSNPAKTFTLNEGADFQLLVLKKLVECGKTLQYVPLFREHPQYLSAVLPCFKGKVMFRLKRREEVLDFLRENKQIA